MIRKANIDDAAAIAELVLTTAADLRDTDFTAQGWEVLLTANTAEATAQRIASENYIVLFYKVDEKVVGMISIKDREKIEHLFVAKKFQGQKIASQLWQSAKQISIEQGNKGHFWLRSSSVAEPVYQSFGFTKVGERKTESGITSQMMELQN